MKRTEFNELKNLGLQVLIKKVLQAKGELADLVLDKNMKKLKDVKQAGKKRRDIAQMMTVIRQKQLLVQLEASVPSAERKGVKNDR